MKDAPANNTVKETTKRSFSEIVNQFLTKNRQKGVHQQP